MIISPACHQLAVFAFNIFGDSLRDGVIQNKICEG